MKWLATLGMICLLLCGCSRGGIPATSSQPLDETPARKEQVKTAIVPESNVQELPQVNAVSGLITYPEKTDVLAILSRAVDQQKQWQFEMALALTQQARAIDPDSPAAKLKERELREIIARL